MRNNIEANAAAESHIPYNQDRGGRVVKTNWGAGSYAPTMRFFGGLMSGASATSMALAAMFAGTMMVVPTDTAIAGDRCVLQDRGTGGSTTGGPDFGGRANGLDALACGNEARTDGNRAVAVGFDANALEANAIAIGARATVVAGSASAIAIGRDTRVNASASRAVLMGAGSTIGNGAGTSSVDSVVIGSNSTLVGASSTIIGTENTLTGNFSFAVGDNLNLTGDSSVAVGSNADMVGNFSVGVGASTDVDGDLATGVGSGATAQGTEATALGFRSNATGLYATSLGSRANALAQGAIAIGGDGDDSAFAGGTTSIGAEALGLNAIAIGVDSYSSSQNSVALGTNSQATNLNGIAIGTSAAANNTNAIAIGDDSDAEFFGVAVGSISQATGQSSLALGRDAQASQLEAVAAGFESRASGQRAIAVGGQSQATADDAIAVGSDSIASGVDAIAIGRNAVSLGSVALGAGAQASGGSAFGDGAIAGTDGAGNAQSTGNTAIGEGATANVVNNTTALGDGAIANVTAGDVALGAGSITAAPNLVGSTTIGGLTLDATQYAGSASSVVSVGSAGAERQITNVAPGRVTATSTDAINGSQLFELAEQVSTISSGGGGAIDYVNVNGTATGAGSNTAANSGALGVESIAIGDSTSAANNGDIAIGRDASAAGANTVALGVASETLGQESVSIGLLAGANGVAGSSFNTAIGGRSGQNVDGTGNAAIGTNAGNNVSGDQNFAGGLGAGTGVQGVDNVSLGTDAGDFVTGNRNIALGVRSLAGTNAAAVTGEQNVAIGFGALSGTSGNNNVAIGREVNNIGGEINSTTAIGDDAETRRDNATAIGLASRANATEGDVALGWGSSTSASTGAAYFTQDANGTRGIVSVGDRRIQGVLAGSAPTEAVNVSQLSGVAEAIDGFVSPTNSLFDETANGAPTTGPVLTVDVDGDGTAENFNTIEEAVQNVAANAGGESQFVTEDFDNSARPTATGNDSSAGGNAARALGDRSVAIGNASSALRVAGVAIGSGATTNGAHSVAIGGDYSGDSASTNGDLTTAVGAGSTANGFGTSAFGTNAEARNTLALAVGFNSTAEGVASIAIAGAQAGPNGQGTIGIGPTLVDNSSIGIGEASISGVQRFTTPFDPIDPNAVGSYNIAIGFTSTANTGDNNVALGRDALSQGGNATALGFGAQATAAGAFAGGSGAQASGVDAIAIGTGAISLGSQAIGAGAQASGGGAAFGDGAIAGTDGAGNAQSAGNTAIGEGATANVVGNTTALGFGATAAVTAGDVALGANSVTTAAAGTSYVTGVADLGGGVVSVGSTGAERRIQNVAAGAAATDAVNVSQLQQQTENIDAIISPTNNIFDDTTGQLAGGDVVTVDGTGYGSVEEAVQAVADGAEIDYVNVNGTTTGAGSNDADNSGALGANAIAIGDSALAQDASSTAIGTGANSGAVNSIAMGTGANTATDANASVAIGLNAETLAGAGSGVAIGNGSSSGAVGAVAIGSQANGEGANSFAGGTNARALGGTSVALGNQTLADGTSSVAVGTNAQANQIGTVAVGQLSTASQSRAVAVGRESLADQTGATAIGTLTDATGTNATAIGSGAQATANGAFAGGFGAEASGADAIAIGTGAISLGSQAIGAGAQASGGGVALGDNAIAGTDGGATPVALTARNVALGEGAIASTIDDSVALGANSVDGGINLVGDTTVGGVTLTATDYAGSAASVVSVGDAANNIERQITNVAPGRVTDTSTDAINGSQLFALTEQVANGAGSQFITQGFAPANAPVASGGRASAGGQDAVAAGANSVALGADSGTDAASSGSVALGFDSSVTNAFGGVAIGGASEATQEMGVSVGAFSEASGRGAIAIGGSTAVSDPNGATGSGADSIAIGVTSSASQAEAIAIGREASASVAGSVALGARSTTGAAVAVTDATVGGTTFGTNTTAGTFAGSAPTSVVSVGSAGNERQITNVAAGQITETSTDAINGSQLWAVADVVDNIATGETGPFVSENAAGDPAPSNTGTDAVAGGFGAQANAAQATAIGNDSQANVDRATALGFGAQANAAAATALGTASVAATDDATAVGFSADALGADSTAVGATALAGGNVSAVVGFEATDNSVANSTVLGSNASIAAGVTQRSVALGQGSTVAADVNGTADVTITNTDGSTTFGGFAGTAPVGAVSVGSAGNERVITNVAAGAVTATSTDAINGSQLFSVATEVNNNAQDIANIVNNGAGSQFVTEDFAGSTAPNASGTNASAGGDGAVASAESALALGVGATASDGTSNIAIGDGALADGNIAGTGNALAIGTNADAGETGSIALGADSSVGDVASNGVAIGTNASVGTDSDGSVVLGAGATALAAGDANLDPAVTSTAGSTVIGAGAESRSTGTVALGDRALAEGIAAIASGSRAVANGAGAIATGNRAQATADRSIAMGVDGTDGNALGAIAGGVDSVAIGTDATTLNANDVALGSNSVTAAAVQVDTATVGGTTFGDNTTAGTFAGNTPSSVVSVGSVGNERQITNVAAGQITETSTDAINGSQLWAVADVVDDLATGEAGPFVSDNTAGAADPTAAGADASAGGFGAVADGAASTVIGNSALDNGVANSTVLGNGASITAGVTQSSVALGQGSTVAADVVGTTDVTIGAVGSSTTFGGFAGTTPAGAVSVGTAGGERVITNVAAGAVTATSTDAINGSQLFSVATEVNNNTQDIANITNGTTQLPYFKANSTLPGDPDAQANGDDAIAIGTSSVADGNFSVAIGAGSEVTTGQGIAIGQSASSLDAHAISIGLSSRANGDGAVSLGRRANSFGSSAVALGSETAALAETATAIGFASRANDLSSTAIGYLADSFGDNSIAMGTRATTAMGANDAVAIGTSAQGGAVNAIAIGNAANATAVGDVALGSGSVTAAAVDTPNVTIAGTTYDFAGSSAAGGTAPASVVSVGDAGAERQITNVAAGQITATSTDAVNGSQLFATNQAVEQLATGQVGPFVSENAGGDPAPSNIGPNSVAGGFGAVANGAGATAVGNDSTATGDDATAFGFAADALGVDSTAIGATAVAGGNGSVVVGFQAVDNAVANSTVLGNGASIAAGVTQNSVALGQGSTVAADVTGTTDVTITNTDGSTTFGGFAGTTPAGAVSVGSVGNERVITNVAAGAVTATSTDAINGSQLFSVATEVNNNAQAIANGAGSQFITEDFPNSVVPTATGLDASAGGNNARALGNQSVAIGDQALAQEQTSIAIGGESSVTSGPSGIAIGFRASAVGDGVGGGGVVIGDNASAIGSSTVAVGRGNQALSNGSTVVGNGSSVGTGSDSGIAIGNNAAVADNALRGVAIGDGAGADAEDSMAFGSRASAQYAGSVAIGADSDTGAAAPMGTGYVTGDAAPASVVSFGSAGNERRLTNVAAGSDATDAVNVSQLQQQTENIDNIISPTNDIFDDTTGQLVGGDVVTVDGTGYGSVEEAVQAVAGNTGQFVTNNFAGTTAPVASAAGASAGGDGAEATGIDAVAIGRIANASGEAATAVGSETIASGTGASAFGDDANALADFSTALGDGADVNGVLSAGGVAVGADAEVNNAQGGVAIGSGARVGDPATPTTVAAGGVAIGGLARANNATTTAVGTGAIANNVGDVALGSGSVSAAANPTANATIAGTTYNFAGDAPTSVVSVGAVGAERQITNVAAGQITATSTDAVNGSQLFATNQAVEQIATGQVGPFVSENAAGDPDPSNAGIDAVAGGFGAQANAAQATAVGNDSQANAANAAAFGYDAQANVANAVALGSGARALGVGDVAIGAGTVTAASAGAAYGTAATNPGNGVVSVGDRRIQGVADGSADDEAVNVAQLRNQADEIDALLGSNDLLDANGDPTGNTLATIGTAPQTTVQGALEAQDVIVTEQGNSTASSFSTASTYDETTGTVTASLDYDGTTYNNVQEVVNNIEGDITNITNGDVGLVQQAGVPGAGNANPITVGAATGGTVVDFTGTDGERTLSGVAAGTAGTDAVNIDQAQAAADAGAATFGGGAAFDVATGVATAPTFTVGNVDSDNVADAITAADDKADQTGGDTATAFGGASTYDPNTGELVASLDYDGGTFDNVQDVVNNIEGDITNITNGTDGPFRSENAAMDADPSNVGENAVAGGFGAVADADGATAVGNDSVAAGDDATALGFSAQANGLESTALGATSSAQGAGSVAIGYGADATADGDIALGAGTVTAASTDASYGTAEAAPTTGVASVGGRRIQGVAAGAADDEAVNVAQLRNQADAINDVIGQDVINPDGTNNTTNIVFNTPDGTTAGDVTTAIENITTSVDDNSTEINNIINGNVGLVQQDGDIDPTNTNPITVGAETGGTEVDFANANDEDRVLTSVADGAIDATSTDAINGSQLFGVGDNVNNFFGSGDVFAGVDPVFVTPNGGTANNVADAFQEVSTQVDGNTTNITNNTTAIENITNGTAGLVQQEGGAPGDGLITVGAETQGTEVSLANSDGADRTLSGVADGEVSDTSNEAVNGSQLFATNELVEGNTTAIENLDNRVTTNETNIAGNTTAIENLDNRVTTNETNIAGNTTAIENLDGRVTNNETNIAGNTTAIENIDGRVTNNRTDIDNLINGTAGLVQQDPTTREITVGADTDGDRIILNNNAGETRTVAGVTDGLISADSTEAVNGSQLFATNEKVTQNMMDIAANHVKIQNNTNAINDLNNTAVRYDTDMNGAPINQITLGQSAGLDGPVIIRNVANGVADNDAVNVGQLRDAVREANDYTDARVMELATQVDGRLNDLEFNLADYRQEAQAGIASVMASSQIRYDDRPGKLSIGAGVGGFLGQISVASGIGYTNEDQDVRINAGFGYNPARNEATWGAGATFTLN
ncbi:hypothetical protein [Alterisphingorhabdus coralli]|uniref:Autotransporter adhesin n=1 Tax=Alterisphingorhabdus coralli TaxID=3071408 RepID=A0AA97HZI6_9SPHN|nr:hypothetical protein [Parasphingorhabdus sp. SCSIO 66989]WOE73892.1 hypothetical protein RB602_08420 [Parasphingorhabdus sp. SCSIO 66989]